MSWKEKTEEQLGKLFIGLVAVVASLSSAQAQETPSIARASIEELKVNADKFTNALDIQKLKEFMTANGLKPSEDVRELLNSLSEETLTQYQKSAGADATKVPSPNCGC